MEKTYSPHAIEQRWYQTWEEKGYFAPQKGDKPSYCIMIPPPNVTGSLHMGHAFQDTIMDALTRYHRMKGDKTLWQAGTDHAGIATQMVVERIINAEGKTRHDYGRDKFIEKTWQWKAESGGTITKQLRRMGSSLDWSRERFTMDEGLSKAVQEVFISLYEEGPDLPWQTSGQLGSCLAYRCFRFGSTIGRRKRAHVVYALSTIQWHRPCTGCYNSP